MRHWERRAPKEWEPESMTTAAVIEQDRAVPKASARMHLFGPMIDFLCLGGGSLLIIFPVILLAPAEIRPAVTVALFVAGQLITQPHFAHSYQIFYSRFRDKLLSQDYPPALRLRYLVSGVLVPASMIAFFLTCLALQSLDLFRVTANLLALTVGWHYVKQGYGILMVECVLKRCFFDDREKARLKFNAYMIWLLGWVFINQVAEESTYQGLAAYAIPLPEWSLPAVMFLASASTLIALASVVAKGIGNGWRLPFNGLLAYVTSVYVWIYAIYLDPVLFLLVPTFHSIQYLAVVWRYQLNKARAEVGADIASFGVPGMTISLPRHVWRLIRFIVIGTTLGVIGFHATPLLLAAAASETQVFGPTTFVVMFFVFFNVHHYFLDNVMWRKENPDVKKHLFTPA